MTAFISALAAWRKVDDLDAILALLALLGPLEVLVWIIGLDTFWCRL